MTKSKVGNNRYLKEFNQTGILDLIRIHKSISRADLSKLTGLSPTAIGGIVSGLLEAGYITEVGIGKSKGGRRPMLLELKPQSFYSIGIDVDTNYLRLVLMDITSKVIDERLVNVPQTLFFEVIIKEIANKTFEIMKDNNIEVKKLLGVGVSIPGMIDSRGGKVILAPNLGWENVDIIEKLTELINLPVFIENEAMASAICEYWVGACQGTKNFVCINIMSGIGSGIFIDGKPYRGAGGTTGEVGHIVVDDSGKKCGCGNYGCLETFSSTNGIIERANHLIKQGVVSKLNDIENIEEINIKTIIDTANKGDEVARNLLIESARFLGLAISSIVNILNPEKIVIGKEFVNYGDIVMDQLQNIVECKALKQPAKDVKIIKSEIGERTSVLGAAIIPLRALFAK